MKFQHLLRRNDNHATHHPVTIVDTPAHRVRSDSPSNRAKLNASTQASHADDTFCQLLPRIDGGQIHYQRIQGNAWVHVLLQEQSRALCCARRVDRGLG